MATRLLIMNSRCILIILVSGLNMSTFVGILNVEIEASRFNICFRTDMLSLPRTSAHTGVVSSLVEPESMMKLKLTRCVGVLLESLFG